MVFDDDELFYERHLPHYLPSDADFHVVIRLTGSLPAEAVEQLRAERQLVQRIRTGFKDQKERKKELRQFWEQYFRRFDSLLDENKSGPAWLQEPSVAEIVKEAIHYRDGKVYDLLAYCIMWNHVHLVVSTAGFDLVGRVADPTDRKGRDGLPSYGLTDIISSLKKYTALRTNRVLGRQGPFWQNESYDHVVRNEDELERTIWYVLENPVKAGLVEDWKEWHWSYVKEGLVE